jgi:hypothetical protein
MFRRTIESGFCLCLLPMLAAQQATQPAMPIETTPAIAAKQQSGMLDSVRIPRYTRVDLHLEQRLSSADSKVGDPIRFTLVNDLVVKGRVVALAGTTCYATVKRVRQRTVKKNGSVKLSDPELDLGNGQRIRVTDSPGDLGDNIEFFFEALVAGAIFAPIWVPALLDVEVHDAIKSHRDPAKRINTAEFDLPAGHRILFVTRHEVRIHAGQLALQPPKPVEPAGIPAR